MVARDRIAQSIRNLDEFGLDECLHSKRHAAYPEAEIPDQLIPLGHGLARESKRHGHLARGICVEAVDTQAKQARPFKDRFPQKNFIVLEVEGDATDIAVALEHDREGDDPPLP